VKTIWKKPYGDCELRLGIPSWDKQNREGKLSIKFVYWKNDRIPRTAPEVPEDVVVDMVAMLAEHGRLSAQDRRKLSKLENLRGSARPRKKRDAV
jgi:hypothetical protein